MNSVTAFAQDSASGPIGRTQGAVAAAQDSSASSSASAEAGTITSSDFLTLLVTELKNQDPTSTQDPNAYIDQLVQVNSLQQLISINQELASPASSPASASLPVAIDPAPALTAQQSQPGADLLPSFAD